jgi:CdiI immunity protein
MMPDHPPRKPTPRAISAADFPALRSFLRGYFHQDMKDEYGSPEEAVREFCSDASGEERAAVAEQWSRFVDQTTALPLEDINRILTGPLGSSYAMTDEDLKRMSAILKARK